MYRGVHAIPFDSGATLNAEVNQRAVSQLLNKQLVVEGDLVIITKGDYVDAQGGTNTLKLIKVSSNIQ